MRYIEDVAADQVVANDPALQEVVQGRRLLLWGPGYSSWVGAQSCMSFGSICSVLAIAFLSPLNLERFWMIMALGLMPVGLSLIGLSQTVLRGYKIGRIYIYRFTQLLSLAASCVVVVCLMQTTGKAWRFALGLSVVGLVLSVTSMLLVAGTGYALASAVFRARRGGPKSARALKAEESFRHD